MAATQLTSIRPRRGWLQLDLDSVWAYRGLLAFLVWRDVKIRYKQTILGALWAIIQPFATMVIFTIIFGNFAKLPTEGVPAPIFYYAALLPWTYFQTAVGAGSNSLVSNSNLITKVYFPRLVVPLATTLTPLVDLAIAFLVLVAMLAYFGIAVTPALLLLPVFVAMAAATAFAFSLWLSALNVRYRDVRYVVPFALQFWMFASPVIYALSRVPDHYRLLYSLNPMVGVIEGFRWAVTGIGTPPGEHLVPGVLVLIVVLVSGLVFFRRTEATFADVI